jgi:hypothetical protein
MEDDGIWLHDKKNRAHCGARLVRLQSWRGYRSTDSSICAERP